MTVERVMVILLNLGIWLLLTLSNSELLKLLAKFKYLVGRGIREGGDFIGSSWHFSINDFNKAF
jgi:hypothetical protein